MPSPVEGETVKQWKERVLGDPSAEIEFYYPHQPGQNTKLTTLQAEGGPDYIEGMMNSLVRLQGMKAQELFDELDENYEQRLMRQKSRYQSKIEKFQQSKEADVSTVLMPREVLDEALDKMLAAPPESLQRVLDNYQDDSIDMVGLLTDVLEKYSEVVKQFRILKEKCKLNNGE